MLPKCCSRKTRWYVEIRSFSLQRAWLGRLLGYKLVFGTHFTQAAVSLHISVCVLFLHGMVVNFAHVFLIELLTESSWGAEQEILFANLPTTARVKG